MENTEVSAIQNEAKNVTLWIAEGAEDFDLRCHFWCSENGEIPIRKREGRAETEVEITPEILQEIVSDYESFLHYGLDTLSAMSFYFQSLPYFIVWV